MRKYNSISRCFNLGICLALRPVDQAMAIGGIGCAEGISRDEYLRPIRLGRAYRVLPTRRHRRRRKRA